MLAKQHHPRPWQRMSFKCCEATARGICQNRFWPRRTDAERMSHLLSKTLSAQLLSTVAAACMYTYHVAPFHRRDLSLLQHQHVACLHSMDRSQS